MPMLALALLAGLLAAALPATAQNGTEILTGHVFGPAGEPLVNAVVSATVLDSGVRRSTFADPRGRYVLIFPGGGSRYELEVARLGMQTESMARPSARRAAARAAERASPRKRSG